MSVSNGQVANETTFNNAFLSRNSNSNTTGIIALDNVDALSGSSVVNIQREHNAHSSYSGMPLNSAKTVKPSWTSTAVRTPTDDLEQRSEALTVDAGQQQVSINRSLIWGPKITKGFADFSTAGLTLDIEALSLNPKNAMHVIRIKHSTAFAGTGITVLTLSLGLVGSLDKYLLPFDVFQAVGDTVQDSVSLFAIESDSGATSIRIAAIAEGANLDQLSAGSVDVWIMKSILP